MNQLTKINFASMTSKEIADVCGKEINHVNRDIKVMLNELESYSPNLDSMYKTVTYTQKVGFGERDNVMYHLNKELTLILVSGYSIALRAKIIDRWQELENQQAKPMSMTEIVAYNAQTLVELERKQLALENKMTELEAKVTATQDNYYTMAGYCSLKGLKFDNKELASLGRQATKISKMRGVAISKFHSAKYGTVNQYHQGILAELV